MSNYQRFLAVCSACGGKTSRKYAQSHNGQCKSCATGQPRELHRSNLKPGQYWEDDGGEYKMSAEYAHEVRGGNDLSPDVGQSDY